MAIIAPKPKGACPRVEGKKCYTFRAACQITCARDAWHLLHRSEGAGPRVEGNKCGT